MTKREEALNRVIDQLLHDVEVLGCTCAGIADDYNRRHTIPGRRRKDSPCSGVALAVRADLLRRRAMRLK